MNGLDAGPGMPAVADMAMLRQQAKDRWGDVPVTVKMMWWDQYAYSVEVFHTISVPEDGQPIRVRLKYDSFRNGNDRTVEKVQKLGMEDHITTYYEEEL